MHFLQNISDDYIKKNAYLGILANEDSLFNPLVRIPPEYEDTPELYLIQLMRSPEYFYFFIHYILGLDMLPTHMAIIRDMWKRKFPVFIASRGFGKSFNMGLYALLRACMLPERKVIVAGAGFRQSKIVYEYIEKLWDKSNILRSMYDLSVDGSKHGTDLWRFQLGGSTISAIPIGTGETIRGQRANDLICVTKDTLVQTNRGLLEIGNFLDGGDYSVLNSDGEFEYPSHIIKTRPEDVYKITTRMGYQIKCSGSHRLMTSNGWKMARDLNNEDYLLIDQNDSFPDKYVEGHGIVVDENLGWLTGVLISEGHIANRHYISVTNTDYDFISRVKSSTNFDWEEYYREPYVDNREFNCKESWTIKYSCTDWREKLYKLGLDYTIHVDKTIPKYILQSPKSVVLKFLSGLYEGDGSCVSYKDTNSGKSRLRITYYSSSEKLCRQLQTILLKFGIKSSIFSRSSELSNRPQWVNSVDGHDVVKLHSLLDVGKWGCIDDDEIVCRVKKPSIRKNGNRFVVETWADNSSVYLGTFDTVDECRQKFDDYWSRRRISLPVKSVEVLPDKEVLYDFHMPESHTFIANGFVNHNCDEFAAINEEVYEQVLVGFAAVSSNPIENAKEESYKKFVKQYHNVIANMGVPYIPEEDSPNLYTESNQICISGTADYCWNHFYRYFDRYRKIIYTKGDPKKLKDIFGGEEVPENFKWDQYAIYRIPIEIVPKGFMDEDALARSKATITQEIYGMEYQTIFPKDTHGFFRASLLEYCSVKPSSRGLPTKDLFKTTLVGNPEKQYVFGIDVASEDDNLAVVILELHDNHRRIVHSWTTNRKKYMSRFEAGLVKEDQFISYVAKKVNDFADKFPPIMVGIDALGGGYALAEALKDKSLLEEKQVRMLEEIDYSKPKPTDNMDGKHIIRLIQFSDANWTQLSNHGMKKDFEDRVLLFPYYDTVELELAFQEDQRRRKAIGNIDDLDAFDTLEDAVEDIQKLKEELVLIVHSRTPAGRERWDTPEQRIGNKSVRSMKKDRYSALLIANSIAREIHNIETFNIAVSEIGGVSTNIEGKADGGNLYGGGIIAQQLNDLYT